MAPHGTVEILNTLSLADFRARFWPPNARFMPAHHAPDDVPWDLHFQTSSTMSERELNWSFQLIHETSSKQYAASSLGWHPIKKKREMRLLDLKYILAKKDWGGTYDPCEKIDGFLSFMLTEEDGIEVIYCYEIHLDKSFQRKGLGKCLMNHLEDVGRKAGVRKAMLTVFEANKKAKAFYENLGYEEDGFSLPSKKLRGGIVKRSGYIILSKSLFDDRESLKAENRSLKREYTQIRDENAKLKDEDKKKRPVEVVELQDENAKLRDENNRKPLEEIGRLRDEDIRLEEENSRKRKFG